MFTSLNILIRVSPLQKIEYLNQQFSKKKIQPVSYTQATIVKTMKLHIHEKENVPQFTKIGTHENK